MKTINSFSKLFFPHDSKADHFKSLDGLRGLAVLFVLLSHSSNVDIFFHETLNFGRTGKLGVYLFFVLSAYLLDRQIAIVFLAKKSSKKYWRNYFLRRFLRIYPLFVIALILHGILTYLGIPTVIDQLIDVPLHMILIKGESIFWSIPVEFKYYFISPIILWFCHQALHWNKKKLLVLFIALIALTVTIELIFRLPLVSTFRYFPIFLIGTIISIYELLYRKKIQPIKNNLIYSLSGALAFLMILLTIPFYFEKIFGFTINFHSPIFYLPYAALWGIILLSAKYGDGIIKSMLELKFLRFIGSISFSLYLFHMLFLNFVKQMEVPQEFKIYIYFFLTILFSSITFLLIERPLSKIKINSKKLKENTGSIE
jgi:peptidoglycan/LPS O-acetylase OafA/YrhL